MQVKNYLEMDVGIGDALPLPPQGQEQEQAEPPSRTRAQAPGGGSAVESELVDRSRHPGIACAPSPKESEGRLIEL